MMRRPPFFLGLLRRLAVVVGLIILAAVVLFGWLWGPDPFVKKYRLIEVGMTQDRVESLLGPGTEIPSSEVPTTVVPLNPDDARVSEDRARRLGLPPSTVRDYPIRQKPVVEGDRVFRWQGEHNGALILVALRAGRIVEKWYWEYSL